MREEDCRLAIRPAPGLLEQRTGLDPTGVRRHAPAKGTENGA